MDEKRRGELDAIFDEWMGVMNDADAMAQGCRLARTARWSDPGEVDWDRVRERASAMAERFCELDHVEQPADSAYGEARHVHGSGYCKKTVLIIYVLYR
ncbi:hypothetical protein [Paratractidigestivibacter faecalis]|uniref:hypothetical protein n=1 Tax=Paratractidigestivibacter faecalis TaxID=2292441 RepID=UPI003AF75F78